MKAQKDRYSTRLSLTSALNVGGQLMPQSLYPGNDPVTIIYEAEWASVLVWMGMENLTGFDPLTVQSIMSSYIDYAIPAMVTPQTKIINFSVQYTCNCVLISCLYLQKRILKQNKGGGSTFSLSFQDLVPLPFEIFLNK
jgi:hypothetical protein